MHILFSSFPHSRAFPRLISIQPRSRVPWLLLWRMIVIKKVSASSGLWQEISAQQLRRPIYSHCKANLHLPRILGYVWFPGSCLVDYIVVHYKLGKHLHIWRKIIMRMRQGSDLNICAERSCLSAITGLYWRDLLWRLMLVGNKDLMH